MVEHLYIIQHARTQILSAQKISSKVTFVTEVIDEKAILCPTVRTALHHENPIIAETTDALITQHELLTRSSQH